MSLQDGVFGGWKPGPGLRAVGRGLLDLIFPPHALDEEGGPRPLASGFSAEAWSRIVFLDDPVCDGCGQPVILLTDHTLGGGMQA